MVTFPRLYMIEYRNRLLFRMSDLLLHEILAEVNEAYSVATVIDVTDMPTPEYIKLLCDKRRSGFMVSNIVAEDGGPSLEDAGEMGEREWFEALVCVGVAQGYFRSVAYCDFGARVIHLGEGETSPFDEWVGYRNTGYWPASVIYDKHTRSPQPFDPAALGFKWRPVPSPNRRTWEVVAESAGGGTRWGLERFDCAGKALLTVRCGRELLYRGRWPESHSFAVQLLRHLGLVIEVPA